MAPQMKDSILITAPKSRMITGLFGENESLFLFVSAEAELANLVCK